MNDFRLRTADCSSSVRLSFVRMAAKAGCMSCVLWMVLAGWPCVINSAWAQPAATSREAPPLKVALLHPGRETDRGWNQLAFEALNKLGQQPGVSVKHDYVPNQSNFKNEMRAFAQQGYDL